MPVPFKKRKRQSRDQVSDRNADDLTPVASHAVETDEEESSDDDPDHAQTTHRGANGREYRPL